jgi:hypothetical protein
MADDHGDALEVLVEEDRVVGELLAAWKQQTRQLEEADDIDVRSKRGTNVKLLLQHLAVRESAIEQVVGARRALGEDAGSGASEADRLEADGVRRRQAISRLEQEARGIQAIGLNNADVSRAVLELAAVFDQEMALRQDAVAESTAALGPPEDRDLRSARYVRTHSPTATSPHPRWYDRVGAIKALRARYDHLRGTPRGGTSPSVDEAREGTPGLRKQDGRSE